MTCTSPTVTFASGIDTWAQPDSKDLMQRQNETVPPGQALQVYRRHSVVPLNGAGSQNTIDGKALWRLTVFDDQTARADTLLGTT